ncbi:hypothetical protein JYG23_07610 [Sedimentibacter sp. zth1]|uniref:FliH/SctL family protein n=1 Tax=Sedimentibacter sp. zth1 TaxID=2816908 RepID=UPI001A91B427|nr:FliH/SctL family protein [Sedimentibacter sp. zth1]QSX07200.1 hypothetical protein JYG23_07610 [Sedimentibacter sp. zth1]
MSSIIKSSDVVIKGFHSNNYGEIKSLNINVVDEETVLEEVNARKEKIISNSVQEAKEIIEKANESKIQIQKEAIIEIQKMKKEAYTEGFELGKKDGYEDGKKQGYTDAEKELLNKKEELVAELLKQICLVEDSKEEVIKNYKDGLSELAINMAEKIIKTEVNQNEDVIKNLLTESINSYKNIEWLKIYLSSKDYITISTDKDIMEKLLKISEHVKLEVLTDSENGELIIETPDNVINAGVNTQVKNLKSIIFGAQES